MATGRSRSRPCCRRQSPCRQRSRGSFPWWGLTSSAILGVPENRPLRSSKSVGDEKSPGPITALVLPPPAGARAFRTGGDAAGGATDGSRTKAGGSIWHFVLTDRGSRDAQWGSAARERGIRFMHRRGIGPCAWCQHARYARFQRTRHSNPARDSGTKSTTSRET